jgi:hypothetical protein
MELLHQDVEPPPLVLDGAFPADAGPAGRLSHLPEGVCGFGFDPGEPLSVEVTLPGARTLAGEAVADETGSFHWPLPEYGTPIAGPWVLRAEQGGRSLEQAVPVELNEFHAAIRPVRVAAMAGARFLIAGGSPGGTVRAHLYRDRDRGEGLRGDLPYVRSLGTFQLDAQGEFEAILRPGGGAPRAGYVLLLEEVPFETPPAPDPGPGPLRSLAGTLDDHVALALAAGLTCERGPEARAGQGSLTSCWSGDDEPGSLGIRSRDDRVTAVKARATSEAAVIPGLFTELAALASGTEVVADWLASSVPGPTDRVARFGPAWIALADDVDGSARMGVSVERPRSFPTEVAFSVTRG